MISLDRKRLVGKKGLLIAGISVITTLSLSFAIAEAAMIADTRDFWNYANKVFNGDIPYEELDNENEAWWVYLPRFSDEEYRREYTLSRIFTWHDFHQGYIRVYYDISYYDYETGKRIPSVFREQRIWYIEKIDGEWKLVGLNPVKP